MVVISSLVFDVYGSLVIKRLNNDTRLEEATRRITRTATLDGSASIYDGGYSAADRILVVGASPFTEAMLERAKYLMENYPRVIVTCIAGGFECSFETYSVDENSLTLRFLVIKDLTET